MGRKSMCWCLAISWCLVGLAANASAAPGQRMLLQKPSPENPTAGCQPAPPNSVAPPPGATPAITITATGTRNFTCGADGKIALSQAIANVTGDYSGLIYYKPDGTPTADYYDKATGKYVGSIDLVLPPTQVPAPNNAAVPLARWAVKSTTGNVPVVSYLTRTETVGGKQPDRCEPAGALLTVPYTSALTYYKC